MTYPNMDLQSLPFLELSAGTDGVERKLQLSYSQVFAALQAVEVIYNGGTTLRYPARVSTAEESTFDTQIAAVRNALVTAVGGYQTIFGL